MASINTNIPSLIARQNLARADEDLNLHLERLATGLRINSGADDPAGLITSERLRAELRGIEQGIDNSERASSVIATTEGALSEVSQLLNSIKGLVVEAANTGAFSPEEIEANQKQIDSAIDSITRISNTAAFADLKLLNGELGYRLSGVSAPDLNNVQINAAKFLDRSSIQVDTEVVESAQQGQLFLRGDFSNLNGSYTDDEIPETVTLRIAGPDGVEELTFISGTTLDEVETAINRLSDSTGVSAEDVTDADSVDGLRFFTDEYGSNSFISIEPVGETPDFIEDGLLRLADNGDIGDLDFDDSTVVEKAKQDEGKDVVAIVNGALATGRGLEVSSKTTELDADLLLTEDFATEVTGDATTFHITGGGSLYQLGPEVNASQQVNIGVQSVAASRLGGTLINLEGGGSEVQFLSSLKSGGENSLASGNFNAASKVIDSAIDEVSSLRGRLGAFERNTLQTNVRSLQAALENVTSANSVIRDADFAAETSALTRSQVLRSAATSVLATANTNAQNVLQLLGG